MTTLSFDEIVAQALQLSPAEQIELVARMREVLYAQTADSDEANVVSPYSPEEISGLMHIEPLSPQEIVARGLVGTWMNMDNIDG